MFSVQPSLSAKDVLIPKTSLGHISKAVKIATEVGYVFFVWNDRVYKIEKTGAVDTGLTINDVV